MIVLAHRGASGHAPENTMAAFRRAQELGADGLELDVQLSADGAVIVLHDEDVMRTSDGKGIASKMTLADLRTLDFGSWFGPGFQDERIPLLSEVVVFVASFGLWLDIELKGAPDVDPRLPAAVAELVRDRLDPARTILSSFDASAIDEAARLLPCFPRALLVERLDAAAWRQLARRSPDGTPFYAYLHPYFRSLDATRVSRAHAAGAKVDPWTLDRRAPLARMLSIGVDGIITGFPERIAPR